MFKEERTVPNFTWKMLGDIRLGRPNLGPQTNVIVYRLMQYTLRDILIQQIGVEKTDEIFYQAGMQAGKELYHHVLTQKNSFSELAADLQNTLRDLQIGVFRVEKSDIQNLNFTFTVEEDLDCSGLPITSEEICTYDEGFISGILQEFTGKKFDVKEVDCWCSGDKICRFEAKPA